MWPSHQPHGPHHLPAQLAVHRQLAAEQVCCHRTHPASVKGSYIEWLEVKQIQLCCSSLPASGQMLPAKTQQAKVSGRIVTRLSDYICKQSGLGEPVEGSGARSSTSKKQLQLLLLLPQLMLIVLKRLPVCRLGCHTCSTFSNSNKNDVKGALPQTSLLMLLQP